MCEARRSAQARWHAANQENGDTADNFIREAVVKLAICGIHVRDRNEELVSRILDYMASYRSRSNRVSKLKPELANWLQPNEPSPEVVKHLCRFSFNSDTARRLRTVCIDDRSSLIDDR